jgi:hypothetical protein
MFAIQIHGFVPAYIVRNDSRRKALEVRMKRFGTKLLGPASVQIRRLEQDFPPHAQLTNILDFFLKQHVGS